MTVEYIHNRQELEHKIVTMHLEGWSIRSLCRHFHLGRNHVRRVVRAHRRHRDEGQSLPALTKKPPRVSKLDAYQDLMMRLLGKYSSITAVRMREELATAGYDGGITIVQERLQRLRPRPKREPVVRFETEPGVQGQMDWSPYTIDFTGSGKQPVLCFSYILGFSRRQYIDFVTHRDFYTLIRRHVDAFGYFGGAPRQCLYDNEKTVVLRWEAGQPVFNPAFIDFITHYQCRPFACRPGRAQTKGKIERPFQYVEGNLLNARTFVDIEDLRSCARWWLSEKSDLHIHETTGQAPLELFLTQEKTRLPALPLHEYDCGEVVLRVCSLDGFVEFETNRYSVPYEYVGDILALKATELEIFIYSPHIDRIASHQRKPAGHAIICEDPEHRKYKHIRYGLEPIREAFERLGDNAPEFLAGLRVKHPHLCGFHARRILLLKERYNSDDIDNACGRANRYHAYDSGAIERILAAQATPRSLESIRNKKAREELEKTLPPVKQRSLSEYSRLFEKKEDADEPDRTDDGQDTQPPESVAAAQDGQGAR
jgi:transposase